MDFISLFLAIVFVIVAFLLIVLVLIQSGREGGLGGMMAGGMQTPFGARSGDIVTKTTAVLVGIFMAGAIFLSLWTNKEGAEDLLEITGPTASVERPVPEGIGDSLIDLSNSDRGSRAGPGSDRESTASPDSDTPETK